jgi:hypothetical protein
MLLNKLDTSVLFSSNTVTKRKRELDTIKRNTDRMQQHQTTIRKQVLEEPTQSPKQRKTITAAMAAMMMMMMMMMM